MEAAGTISWVVYALAVLAGTAILGALSLGQTLERLEPVGMLGLIGLFFFLTIGMVLRVVSPWLVLAGLCAAPLLLAWLDRQRRSSGKTLETHRLKEELRTARAFLEAHPEDDFPFKEMAHVYQKIGEYALASQYLARAAATTPDRFKADDLRRKAAWMLKDRPPRALIQEEPYRDLCACLHCGDILCRRDRLCDGCGNRNFPSGWRGLWVLARETLEDDLCWSVFTAGALSLPFLFTLGSLPYNVLWGLWSLTLFRWQRNVSRRSS